MSQEYDEEISLYTHGPPDDPAVKKILALRRDRYPFEAARSWEQAYNQLCTNSNKDDAYYLSLFHLIYLLPQIGESFYDARVSYEKGIPQRDYGASNDPAVINIPELLKEENLTAAANLWEQAYIPLHINSNKDDAYYRPLSHLIDLLPQFGKSCCKKAESLLDSNAENFNKTIPQSDVVFTRAMIKKNQLPSSHPSFFAAEGVDIMNDFVIVKNLLWSIVSKNKKLSPVYTQYQTELASALSGQFRVTEFLHICDDIFDRAQKEGLINSPEARDAFAIVRHKWILALEDLRHVYGHHDKKLLNELKNAYEQESLSKILPESDRKHVAQKAKEMEEEIIKNNAVITAEEEKKAHEDHSKLSHYRKVCFDGHLILDEQALYDKHYASETDGLTLSPQHQVAKNNSMIIKMETCLNLLKSEFTFARHNIYSYFYHQDDMNASVDVNALPDEKIKAAFKTCYSILDKIAVAVCELFQLKAKRSRINFFNIWTQENKELLNELENPGVLALYSIATDLTYDRSDETPGQFSYCKQWRNDLEHNYLILVKNNKELEQKKSKLIEPVKGDDFEDHLFNLVKEGDFKDHLFMLLQLTRSAIFSFVFAARKELYAS